MDNQLTHKIIGCAIEAEKNLPVTYKGNRLDCGYRIDFVIDSQVTLEFKSIQEILPIHEAQLLTYLKIARIKTGLLINFIVKLLKDGVKRFVL